MRFARRLFSAAALAITASPAVGQATAQDGIHLKRQKKG